MESKGGRAVSDFAEKRRREMFERLKHDLGEKRWLKFMEMAESGELARERKRFFELLERDDLEKYLQPYDAQTQFPKYFN